MPRFTFPEWTETLKKWINLLVLVRRCTWSPWSPTA